MKANYFTILWWFLPYVDMNPMSPCPEPLSHLPPHPIPLGCPSALALSALFHTLNLDWSSISHMVIYMFQCYSLKSSHPRLLPHSLKVCSLHLCLFCCLAYRFVIQGRPGMLWFMGSQRVGHNWATELNWTEILYICISILYWCFSFWLTSLYIIRLQFHLPH